MSWVFLRDKSCERLAQFAAQIEGIPGTRSTGEHADFHDLLPQVGYLDGGHDPVPVLRLVEHVRYRGPDRIDACRIINVNEYGSYQRRVLTRPVLERSLHEVVERDDEPTFVPEPDDDVGGGNLLHVAELALDDEGVVYTNRLCQRELNSGKKVLQ